MISAAIAGFRPAAWAPLLPGALLAAAIAVLCDPTARLTSIPAPLVAVALGMAVGCIPQGGAFRAGYVLWAKPGLKLGVALLGAQVAWSSLMALGLPVALAAGGVVATGVGIGAIIGVLAGLGLVEALIAACAVSICGASAAMAASSALPGTERSRKTTTLVVVGVNLLSTAAMVLYPLLAAGLGMSENQTGVFLGLSIHDVAQVAGAGESVSPLAAGTAALAKLSRVLWLGPAVVMVIAILVRFGREASAGQRPSMAPPMFVLGFAGLVVARSLGLIPNVALEFMAGTSHLLLLGGVAALTAQVSPREILRLEPRLLLSLIATTALVGVLAITAALYLVR